MKAWSHDPRKFLLMNLKLVEGIHFSNPLGEILASIPDVLEATVITKWQYRIMLAMDGKHQFVEVVRDVQNDYNGEFEATDVWMFLDWLIEKDLLERESAPNPDLAEEESVSLPDLVEPTGSTHTWLKVPLQIFGMLLICGTAAFSTYVATPFLLAYLAPQEPTPMEQIPTETNITEVAVIV